MAEPVLAAQIDGPPAPVGAGDPVLAPHGVYPCLGDDQWVAVAVGSDAAWVGMCGVVPGLAGMAGLALEGRRGLDEAIGAWSRGLTAGDAAPALRAVGVAAEPVAGSVDLLRSAHLAGRGFWDAFGPGVLPGLPWQASFGRVNGPAPGLGEHTDAVLAEVLGLDADRIGALRAAGALG